MTDTTALTLAQIDELEALLLTIGRLPLDPKWMYSVIRHGQRNMDLDVIDGFNKPDRQSGLAIGLLINNAPTLLTLARQATASAEREARLREALQMAIETLAASRHMLSQYMPYHHWLPKHDKHIATLKAALATYRETTND